jgi:hypothetical protein
MTEAEWLACEDPERMLEFLRGPVVIEMRDLFGRRVPFEGYPEQRGSDRQRRLLAVALCRRYWHLLDESHSRKLVEVGDDMSGQFSPSRVPLDSCQKAVELAERSADEPVAAEALEAASEAADLFHHPAGDYAACYVDGWGPYDHELIASGNAASAASRTCDRDMDFVPVCAVVRYLIRAEKELQYTQSVESNAKEVPAEYTVQAALVRNIFGNPFRPVVFSQEWRTDTAVALAKGMYESRVFSAMPILADALQDAGCDNEDILNHCRQPGEHVRGCWVIDLLTGRK